MSSLESTVTGLAKDRTFTLRRGDWIFERILAKTDKFLVYDTQSKKKPLYTIPEEKFEEEWVHSTVIRLTKLTNDSDKTKALFDLFDVRKSINYEQCPHLLTFHEQGLIQWSNNLYYAVRYDDPSEISITGLLLTTKVSILKPWTALDLLVDVWKHSHTSKKINTS
jgi:hypothetical protein